MTAFMLSHVASRGAGRRLRPLEADVSSASFMDVHGPSERVRPVVAVVAAACGGETATREVR